MKQLPYMFQRRHTFEIRIRVPKDLVAVLGKAELLKSLKTRDLSEATRRYAAAVAELRGIIDTARAKMTPTIKPDGSAEMLTSQGRRELVEDYRRRRFDDLRLERGDTVAKCRAAPAAFWAGHVVPLPINDFVNGASFWHHVASDADTPIEVAILYALRCQLEDCKRRSKDPSVRRPSRSVAPD